MSSKEKLKEKIFSEFSVFMQRLLNTEMKNVLLIAHSDIDCLVSTYCFEKYLIKEINSKINIEIVCVPYTGNDDIYFNRIKQRVDTSKFDTVIMLDHFREKFPQLFLCKNFFCIEHHKGTIDNINIFNISNYFKKPETTSSLGSFLFSYTRDKVNYPQFFTMIAKLTDGLYNLNSTFIKLTKKEEDLLMFFGLPRYEFLEITSFFEAFINMEEVNVYPIFRKAIDSNDFFYYRISNDKEISNLREIYKKYKEDLDNLIDQLLTTNKPKIFEKEHLCLIELEEKDAEFNRPLHKINEIRYPTYFSLILIKLKEGYKISYRSSTIKFNAIKKIKPTVIKYCDAFNGHPQAGGGFVKIEYKDKFVEDVKIILNKHFEKKKN
ncbi:MAG: hypothetical protein V1824_03420 [archaeon]